MDNNEIKRLANDVIADANQKIRALDIHRDGFLTLKQNFDLQRQLGRIDTAKALLELLALNARLKEAA